MENQIKCRCGTGTQCILHNPPFPVSPVKEPVEELNDGRILRFCSRCGKEWCKMGKVLEWGKHYPAFTVKKDGEIKDYPEYNEIKKAVCRDCAKDLFDNLLLSQTRKETKKEIGEHILKIYEDNRKSWNDTMDEIERYADHLITGQELG